MKTLNEKHKMDWEYLLNQNSKFIMQNYIGGTYARL
jgi:hypothetical protein